MFYRMHLNQARHDARSYGTTLLIIRPKIGKVRLQFRRSMESAILTFQARDGVFPHDPFAVVRADGVVLAQKKLKPEITANMHAVTEE